MIKKIFSFFCKIILPFIVAVLFVVLIYLFNVNIGMYIIVAITNLLAMYYLSLFILGLFSIGKEPVSLYSWLDSLNGGESLLIELFSDEKEERCIVLNLERVYSKIMGLTKHNLHKLRLLRAYYRIKSEEDAVDVIFKAILGVFVTILVWGISRGIIWTFASTNLSIYDSVSKNYTIGWRFAFIMWVIIVFFAAWIRDYFNGKKRIKLIVEILDVCIKNSEK
ncbi:hypothetical protein [Priestia megaterium]|uniref:hypothetical protein n=1 Tax=Priestia megaterium TaxID=1404 RepID=UPI0011272879|nr:hypothetical protein [Priestia megaterium]TPF14232.1 hypothetical protein CBE78_26350 [Priestia megaterium]TPF19544.1 hypothetical protein CBE79_26570 [Priestia megaterium]